MEIIWTAHLKTVRGESDKFTFAKCDGCYLVLSNNLSLWYKHETLTILFKETINEGESVMWWGESVMWCRIWYKYSMYNHACLLLG